MRPRVNLEKRGRDWVVFLRSGRVEFSSTSYAKAVGVFDYLEMRVAAQESIRGGGPASLRSPSKIQKSLTPR